MTSHHTGLGHIGSALLEMTVRLPILCTSAAGVLVVAEFARRGIVYTWQNSHKLSAGQETQPTPIQEPHRHWENLTFKEQVHRVVFPFADKDFSLLVKIGAVALAMGIIGTTAAAWAFGEVPPMYNYVLSYLGPIRVSDDMWIGFANWLQSVK